MLSITIRDKATADEQSSQYTVLIATGGTSYSAYKTIAEFMLEWHDSINHMQLNANSFVGQKALNLTADWSVHDSYEYSDGLQACIDNGARECQLLSNGTVRRGAILVDKANRQTTFFRLNPNDKGAK